MPLSYYKVLKNAHAAVLQHYQLIANGAGIHWPELDEDLSLKGFLKFLTAKSKKRKRIGDCLRRSVLYVCFY
ncbi:MAG: DUF2442 domain-containing protein [Bacteroidota bacterium]|nr:DUF2442 domain-containing protein [Bacteroidota bacterium]